MLHLLDIEIQVFLIIKEVKVLSLDNKIILALINTCKSLNNFITHNNRIKIIIKEVQLVHIKIDSICQVIAKVFLDKYFRLMKLQD
jgi:hypothetical protein